MKQCLWVAALQPRSEPQGAVQMLPRQHCRMHAQVIGLRADFCATMQDKASPRTLRTLHNPRNLGRTVSQDVEPSCNARSFLHYIHVRLDVFLQYIHVECQVEAAAAAAAAAGVDGGGGHLVSRLDVGRRAAEVPEAAVGIHPHLQHIVHPPVKEAPCVSGSRPASGAAQGRSTRSEAHPRAAHFTFDKHLQ